MERDATTNSFAEFAECSFVLFWIKFLASKFSLNIKKKQKRHGVWHSPNETYVKFQKHLQNVNNKNTSDVLLVFLLLTLNIFHTFF